jgi:hypothetical protein
MFKNTTTIVSMLSQGSIHQVGLALHYFIDQIKKKTSHI